MAKLTTKKLANFYNDYRRFTGKYLEEMQFDKEDWGEYKRIITPKGFTGEERDVLFFSGVKITEVK